MTLGFREKPKNPKEIRECPRCVCGYSYFRLFSNESQGFSLNLNFRKIRGGKF